MASFRLISAPLEGYSERALRAVWRLCGSDMQFTEMTRLESLSRNNKATWRLIDRDDSIPTSIQLLAQRTDDILRFGDLLREKQQTVSEINFNLGCPSDQVIKLGLGCAAVKRIGKTNELIEAARTHLPGNPKVSIKLRLGMNNQEAKAGTWLNLIKQTSADYYIVHARHGRQSADDKPDWQSLSQCADTGKQVFANGDVLTAEHCRRFMDMGLAGVMIGRAAVRHPFIFYELKQKLGILTGSVETKNLTYSNELDRQQRTNDMYMQMVYQYYGHDPEQWPPWLSTYIQDFKRQVSKGVDGTLTPPPSLAKSPLPSAPPAASNRNTSRNPKKKASGSDGFGSG